MTLTAAQITAVIDYCHKRIAFTQCRKILNPAAREQGMYVHGGGSIARRMEAGLVAQAIRDVECRLGAEFERYPVATWCGHWGQTIRASNAIQTGYDLVTKYEQHIVEVTL